MDKSCLASMNLIKIGKSVPNRSTTLFPKTPSGFSSINSCREVPPKFPFEITETSPFTVDNSQLSPVISFSIGFPKTSLSFVPPQRRSFNIG